VLSHGSMVVKIEESRNRRITLCREHMVTVGFPNYKCILMHTKETHFYPTANGILSWRSITSCDFDLDTGLENWQHILHEFSRRRCTRIYHTVRWVGMEIREPPSFHGVNELEEFLTIYEHEVLENQSLLSLDITLKATPTRWWGVHKETVKDWYQCKRLLHVSFNAELTSNEMKRYDGQGTLAEHMEK
jgi:hypothetical protein